jgi:uncharacterized protein
MTDDGPEIRSAQGTLARVVVARFAPGTELLQGLARLMEAEDISSAIILGGAASLVSARLRNVQAYPAAWPITDHNRVYIDLSGPLELLSISGNASRRPDGQAHIHAHVVVSTGGPQAAACYGGHLVEGARVLSTAEIAIGVLGGMRLWRRDDPETRTLELYPEPV